jgi:Raf kinase inhibitor-like YbhB/YbcL family protein
VQLTSPAFPNGSAIPRRFTCNGQDLSPPLEWREAPAPTRSFVLLCIDPDAPSGPWHHWAVYGIPPERTMLVEGAGGGGGKPLEQAVNDFRRTGYGGLCPPRGHGPHHYRFELLALAVERLTPPTRPQCRDVARQARRHALAEAVLVGTYER